MSAYGTLDARIAGQLYGVDYDIETKVVPSGVSFAFGAPVFVDAGDENTAYAPDSTDASLKFLGVACISHRSYDGSEDEYVDFQDMNVVTRGEIYVAVASGLTNIANAAAYVIDDAGEADFGKFTTANVEGSYSTGGYFRSNVEGGLARLQLRGIA